MTVNSLPLKDGPYLGNGSTEAMGFTFRVFSDFDVRVIQRTLDTNVEVDLDLNINYRVERHANQEIAPGGTIYYQVGGEDAPFPVGYSFTFIPDYEFEQPTDIPNGGSFFAANVEKALDRNTLLIKQLKRSVDSGLQVTPATDVVFDPTIPEPEAGKFLVWQSDGSTLKLVNSDGTGADAGLRADLASTIVGSDGSRIVGYRSTLAGAIARSVQNKLAEQPMSILDFGAVDRTGATSAVAAFVAAIAVAGAIGAGALYVPDGTYLIDSNIALNGLSNFRLFGAGPATVLKLSGNNRRCFLVDECTDLQIDSMVFDGQKPNVGWETTNNFDFAIRVGEFSTVVSQRLTFRNLTFKDIALDGIYLAAANSVLIESITSVNCRRAGIAAVAGAYGIKDLVIRRSWFFCDFAGGPVGKERPLFALDIEPDSGHAATENVVIESIYIHQGRLSVFSNPPAVISKAAVRNCDIVGAHGELAIDACAPWVSGINLLEGAYALIDNTADTFAAQPVISGINCNGRAPKINADGRANLLPRDFVALADGTLSQAGTGSNSYTYHNLDGVPASVSNFAVGIGTGNANVTIPTTVSIAADDNVWIILKVNVTAGASAQNVIRVVYGTTIDRRYALAPGEQWLVIAVKATGADVNPTFFFGASGTVATATSIRCTLSQVLVNPVLADMPSMKVVKSNLSKTFAAWAGTTLDAYNVELGVINAAVARNLDAINGATDQVVPLQSVGAGVITIRDTGTSGVGAGAGGIKLSGGGTVALTSATFKRHSDGFWYRV